MPAGKLILLGLLGFVMAEVAVFLTLVWVFGAFTTIFALLATSAFGLLILARMGRRFAGRLADILSHRDFGRTVARSSGLLTTIGAVLLVVPGFITDGIGLLLLIPAVQQRLRDAAPVGRSPPASRVLELDRSQWRDLPERHVAEDRDRRPKGAPKRTPRP